jgi:bacillithiol biosynthesis cysteine-adding enzyme BshC
LKSDCLPFSQIPHSTRLFIDLLTYSPGVRAFYPHSPYFQEWMKDEASRISLDPARRERVAAILERQNRQWNASPKTIENIGLLRQGAAAVVTGQQVGLFGGPAFTIYKALTAVRLASQASEAGITAVPVFWLATNDHDLAEVNHISIPGPESLQLLATPTHGLPDAPVGTVTFGEEIVAVAKQAAELMGDSEISHVLQDCYRPEENFGSAFARLFAHLFAEWGVILLDAGDPELAGLAGPIYRGVIESGAELEAQLLARGKELDAAGYHQQVKVTPASTLLFALQEGSRVPVLRRANGTAEADYTIGKETVSRAELLRRISEHPEHFNPNVLLRPIVQDFLLPTLAYTGGAAEVAYFAQAAVVYQKLLGRITPVIPRFSATILEEKFAGVLQRYGLNLTDLFEGPDAVREKLAAQHLPRELQQAFDEAGVGLEKSLSAIRGGLEKLDKTLVEAAQNAGEKMQYQLTQLRSRAARAEIRQSEVLARKADVLSRFLFPNKTLQEREIAGVYFVAQHGRELLKQLYETIQPACLDHQVITL